MNKQENIAINEQLLKIYNGIIANNPLSNKGISKKIKYQFNCPEFKTLKGKYSLETIAGKGSDFNKAKRILNYLAPRLYHSGYYDNHIECNALSLLEYSLDNKEHGINCLNKAKILQECLLALKIYARRVFMMPYSPFDMDNHVVVEIYDRKLQKWIMLDPTTNCYMIDKNNNPLSLMEMREFYGNNETIVPVEANKRKINFERQYQKHISMITYYAKNCFYFLIDEYSSFGDKDGVLTFAPNSFSFGNWRYQNAKYRLNYLTKHSKEIKSSDMFIKQAKQRLISAINNMNEKEKLNKIAVYLKNPTKKEA